MLRKNGDDSKMNVFYGNLWITRFTGCGCTIMSSQVRSHSITSYYITLQLDPADNTDKKVVCPDPTIPAASSLFNITSRTYPMCPGGTANYTCNAGGLNAFKVILNFVNKILTFFSIFFLSVKVTFHKNF